MTGRVGLLQSDGKMGSHTTRIVKFPDFCWFSTFSAAEAPRRHPGHVGDNKSTILTSLAVRLNSLTNACALVSRVSGGWPLGVIPDQRKYQAISNATAKPIIHADRLVFITYYAPSNQQSGLQPLEATRSPGPQQQRQSRTAQHLSCSVCYRIS